MEGNFLLEKKLFSYLSIDLSCHVDCNHRNNCSQNKVNFQNFKIICDFHTIFIIFEIRQPLFYHNEYLHSFTVNPGKAYKNKKFITNGYLSTNSKLDTMCWKILQKNFRSNRSRYFIFTFILYRRFCTWSYRDAGNIILSVRQGRFVCTNFFFFQKFKDKIYPKIHKYVVFIRRSRTWCKCD